MSKTSGAVVDSTKPKITQWTRVAPVASGWSTYDSFESLIFSPPLRAQIQKLALSFLSAEDLCAKAKLPWRKGLFVFGNDGVGKSAVSRAIALQLGWAHFTIPSYEILDVHHLTRAFADVPAQAPAVVVIDNIDEIFKRVDPRAFFDFFDQVSERTNGIFWIATSRHPEDVPKAQLVRPGRFEQVLRLAAPNAETKKSYYETYLEPFMGDIGPAKAEHLAVLEANPSLTYAHLHEMRQLMVEVLMQSEAGESDALGKVVQELQSFCQEQTIAGDRSGGARSEANDVEERVRLSDPRLLISALQVTDAFKRIVEMTVTSNTEAFLGGSSVDSTKIS